MVGQTAGRIAQELQRLHEENERKKRALDEDFERQREAQFAPVRARLDEIAKTRLELDKEEMELLEFLGEKKTRRRRRSGGKRVTAMHKKEAIAKFIQQGHIKDGMDLTKSLRTALSDAGFGTNDFRKLSAYLPSGWSAHSNGLRGIAAKTTFHKA